MKRGEVVLIAAGKPRPAVIVQDDRFATPVDVLLCPFTSTLLDAPIYRLHVAATVENGLDVDSQLMVDKIGPTRRDRINKKIGRLTETEMAQLTSAMAAILGVGN